MMQVRAIATMEGESNMKSHTSLSNGALSNNVE